MWPPVVTLDQPIFDEPESELVQADLVVGPVRSVDSQSSGRSVEIVQPDLCDLLGADAVDSDQGEGEFVLGAGDVVQEPPEPV